MSHPTDAIRRQAMLHYFNQHLYAQGLISEQARNQLKLSINKRYAPKSNLNHPAFRSSATRP